MKLLIDMNLSPRWIRTLVDAGIDAEHWSTLGKAVVEALRQMSDLLEQAALLTVDPVRARLRALPLERKSGVPYPFGNSSPIAR